jgi:hypothetical protein
MLTEVCVTGVIVLEGAMVLATFVLDTGASGTLPSARRLYRFGNSLVGDCLSLFTYDGSGCPEFAETISLLFGFCRLVDTI